jgi:hypothetical protein
LLVASTASAFITPLPAKLPGLRTSHHGVLPPRAPAVGARRAAGITPRATMLPLDSAGQWAGFLLWSVPLPVTIGALLRVAEGKVPQIAPVADAAAASPSTIAKGPAGVQRNLMWAFPSFSVLLKDHAAEPPLTLSLPTKLALFVNSWAGLGWYLYYKWQIEDELRDYTGEGLGGQVRPPAGPLCMPLRSKQHGQG